MRKQRASGSWRATFDWARTAPVVVSVVLGGAILVDSAHVGGRILGAQRGFAAAGVVKAVARPSRKMFETQAVVRAHLFGTASDRSHRVGDVDVATSQAPLVLTGTIALADPARGSAILGGEKASHLYPVGAQLPDGSWMREVYPDRIVLERDGVLEALRLHKLTGTAGTLAATLTADNSDRSAASGVEVPNETRNPREFSHARQWFNGFMARQAPSSDGSFAGFVLHPMPRYKRQYGLKDGDVVTAINGEALDDPDAAARVLQHATGSSVEFTIQRDGAPQQVKLPLGS